MEYLPVPVTVEQLKGVLRGQYLIIRVNGMEISLAREDVLAEDEDVTTITDGVRSYVKTTPSDRP